LKIHAVLFVGASLEKNFYTTKVSREGLSDFYQQLCIFGAKSEEWTFQ